jgi:hypothetical protein
MPLEITVVGSTPDVVRIPDARGTGGFLALLRATDPVSGITVGIIIDPLIAATVARQLGTSALAEANGGVAKP